MATRSCADRLHQIQKDVGLSDKELKQAVKEVTTPREVKLPVYKMKKTPEEKLHEKVEKIGKKKRRYQLAHWYLNEYLKPERASLIYLKYQDFDELVDYAYECAMGLVQLTSYVVKEIEDPLSIFPEDPRDELDIPEAQEKEFHGYCEKHPIEHRGQILARRRKFQKKRTKKRKYYYSKKRMRMYDPLFAATIVNKKEMIRNMKRVSYENELRVREFNKMLDRLVGDRSIGSVAMKAFNKQTKEIMDTQKRRLKAFMKELGHKETPVIFDVDPFTSN